VDRSTRYQTLSTGATRRAAFPQLQSGSELVAGKLR